ncbi:hypothetical protein GGI19_000641 [Coemansia pectinata]|uniref:Letm1 RBD domain-containing protein n=1 Tax=Coemansia pectinata TaxID=1052879 RepID=A0A9W8LC06_9FUNG|nr:hypothetical protein GGI19_000641 [Coemansia pectinata]
MSLRLVSSRPVSVHGAARSRLLWSAGTLSSQQQRAFTLLSGVSQPQRPQHRQLLNNYTAIIGSRSMGIHTSVASRSPWPTGPVDTNATIAVETRADPTLPGQTLTLFQKVKGFISFYKGGLKELVSNIKAASKIKDRLAAGSPVSRDELQIHRRTPADKLRLVPFGFLVVVIPELIPLTIFLFPGVCPSTCVTYGQVAKMAAKSDATRMSLHARAVARIEGLGLAPAAFADAKSLADMAQDGRGGIFDVDSLVRDDLQLVCRFLGLGKIGLVNSEAQLRARLAAHLEYIRTDDQLLLAEQAVDCLGLTELYRACQERAIPSSGRSGEQLRASLRAWTEMTRDLPVLPIVWSRLALFNQPI